MKLNLTSLTYIPISAVTLGKRTSLISSSESGTPKTMRAWRKVLPKAWPARLEEDTAVKELSCRIVTEEEPMKGFKNRVSSHLYSPPGICAEEK